MSEIRHPVLLVLFNGWGYRAEPFGNVITEAETPNYDQLWEAYPHTVLAASGLAVGLPEGAVGCAAAGYPALAAGQPVEQPALRLDRAVADGSFAANPVLLEAAAEALTGTARLHLVGQVSDGQVVSAERHYFELIRAFGQAAVPGDRVFVHAILDGHDTPARSGMNYLARFAAEMLRTGIGRVATLMGRRYGMATAGGWEATERAYAALVHGAGRLVPSAIQALQAGYSRGESDSNLSPAVVLGSDGLPLGRVESGDVVVSFNHRGEEIERLLRALLQPELDTFAREQPPDVRLISLTDYPYLSELGGLAAFPSPPSPPTIGRALAAGRRRVAVVGESLMARHLERFGEGMPERLFERRLLASPPFEDILVAPARVADELTSIAVELLSTGRYDLVVLDYTNADLAGHTGNVDVARAAVEALDAVLPPLVRTARRARATMILTSTHGNVEDLSLPNAARPNPAHTAHPVPLLLIDDRLKGQSLSEDREHSLADIAPTVLDLLGVTIPDSMTGQSLVRALRPTEARTGSDDPWPAALEIGPLEAMDMMLAITRDARDLYLGAAERATDPESAALYRHLAGEEERRFAVLTQRHALLATGQDHAHDEHPNRETLLPPAPGLMPLAVLEMAIREEMEVCRILTEIAARNLDPQGTAVFEQLATEAHEFVGRLQQLCESEEIRLLAALTPPAGGRAR